MHSPRTQQAAFFCGWEPKHTALWGRQPICVGHRLHESPLFSLPALADLIEGYPRSQYSIIHMGALGGGRRFWREGDIGGVSGRNVISAITEGRLWLNLRDAGSVDKRIADLVDEVFTELEERVPGLVAWKRRCAILISSPKAQVYYHADLPAHTLFQIAGRKKVFFYPPSEPFLRREDLEHIAIHGLEVDIPYRPWYDEYAHVVEFEPGQMVFWPHTAPHRIENYDSLNVSLTFDFVTEAVRRSQMVTLANGLLRYRFGRSPSSNTTAGLNFWSKALLQKFMRNSAWLKKQKASARQIHFSLENWTPEFREGKE